MRCSRQPLSRLRLPRSRVGGNAIHIVDAAREYATLPESGLPIDGGSAEYELPAADSNVSATADDIQVVHSDIEATEPGEDAGTDPLSGTAAFDATGDRTMMPSWDELVREHADRVYRLAYRLTGDPQDAEDLTQETFIRVFRSLSSYQAGTFEGWLHRITTNLFLDMVRRRNRIRMEALPDDYDRVPSDTPDPEQVYHDARLDPDLQSALDSLAPEFRAAVVLCDIEGLSYEEIGATLGVKLGTVRSRIHRGRQALRDYLAHNGSQQRFTAEEKVG
ncbi:RNA polymerase sigma factor SigE [Nocardia terpenica]|uniref:RNA polymerase sigma factor SigE n=1 Tax=Nocardia terpenica TaxID=455432 RepID=A0A291RYB2_9NOCA|nr:RNA polymerase sigma factor SigE [Nocardia terpenica]ATL72300.1 RNA polymerase sigma factor SigE [Nocardia terpenica]